jgi:rhodanese-related sulfurtransferase
MPESGYKEIDPPAASQVLATDPKAIYLDVRSQREFAAGHVAGAYNIPIAEPDATGQMAPNDDFLRMVHAVIPKETKLIVGCKSGGRSARAAQVLLSNGYSDVANLKGGLHGHQSWSGQMEDPGWIGSGLPVTNEAGNRDYATLRGQKK